jgi:hypothetical protein
VTFPWSIQQLAHTLCCWNLISFPDTEFGNYSWLWFGFILQCTVAASTSGLQSWMRIAGILLGLLWPQQKRREIFSVKNLFFRDHQISSYILF